MRKEVQISFGDFYFKKFSKPIRHKKDIVLLILDTVNLLILGNFTQCIKGSVRIATDKMSRIFYQLSDKYYSIVFPFSIEHGEEGTYTVYDSVLDVELNSRMVSLMKSILDKVDLENTAIDRILEQIYYDGFEQDYSDKEVEDSWRITSRLYAMETGYIRYDYDSEHQDEDFHPLNHLDINYSTKGTYKLGLRQRMQMEEFIDLLDIRTECKFIV